MLKMFGKYWKYVKRNVWPILVLTMATNLLMSLLPLRIIINLLVLGISFIFMCREKLQAYQEIGLVTYLPKFLQKLLLHRSILDVFADFWFMPTKLKVYFRALILPFFDISLDPSEVKIELTNRHTKL